MPLHEVVEQAQAEMKVRMGQAQDALQAMRKSEAEQRSALLALDVAVDAAEKEIRNVGEQVWSRTGGGGERAAQLRAWSLLDRVFFAGGDAGGGGGAKAGGRAVQEAAAGAQGGGL